MAITATGSTSNASNNSAGATLAVTPNNDVLPGDLMVVAVAADNAGAAGVSSISSVSDAKGNTYSLVKNQNRTAAAAANDGCTVAIYVSRCTVKMVGAIDAITVNFSPNTAAKCVRFVAFRGVEDIAYSTNGVAGTGATYNSAATATASAASGDLVFVAVASESNTAPTVDADSTNGSWVSATTVSGGGGGDATKMSILIQYKIVTGTGTQTASNTATNSDWAVAWGLFTVPTTKSDTETGSGADAGEALALTGVGDTGAAVDAGTMGDPPGLSVSVVGSNATLTWDASPTSEGVSGYDLYRRSPPTGAAFVPGSDTPVASGVTSPYIDASLAAGSYEWEVFGTVTMYASDSFNRVDNATSMGSTDSAFGGSTLAWVTSAGGDFGISSNQAKSAGASQAIARVDAGVADCTVEVTLSVVSDDGVLFRFVDDNNYWLTSPNTLYKKVAGSFSAVASFAAIASGSVVTATLSGSSIIVKDDGVQVASVSDSFNSTATKHGLRSNSGVLDRFDNFKVYG